MSLRCWYREKGRSGVWTAFLHTDWKATSVKLDDKCRRLSGLFRVWGWERTFRSSLLSRITSSWNGGHSIVLTLTDDAVYSTEAQPVWLEIHKPRQCKAGPHELVREQLLLFLHHHVLHIHVSDLCPNGRVGVSVLTEVEKISESENF